MKIKEDNRIVWNMLIYRNCCVFDIKKEKFYNFLIHSFYLADNSYIETTNIQINRCVSIPADVLCLELYVISVYATDLEVDLHVSRVYNHRSDLIY